MAKVAKKVTGVLLFVLILAGIITLSSSMVITKENEYTLIKKFGKIERVVDKAGLSFKVPFVETSERLPRHIMFYDMMNPM